MAKELWRRGLAARLLAACRQGVTSVALYEPRTFAALLIRLPSMRAPPERLDNDEDPDPYGLGAYRAKDKTPEKSDLNEEEDPSFAAVVVRGGGDPMRWLRLRGNGCRNSGDLASPRRGRGRR
jgi:hypothetical protein